MNREEHFKHAWNKATQERDNWVAECDRLRAALGEIACMPEVQRNPDGVDQAAATMKLIAREALDDVVATNQIQEAPDA